MEQKLKNIHLLIFDLDGTLVNSMPDLHDAVNYALHKLEYPSIEYDQMPSLVGGGVKQLIELAFPYVEEEELLTGLNHFLTYYEKNLSLKTRCYEGVTAILDYYGNKTKAVLSNKKDAFTKEVIRQLDLDKYFDLVLGEDVEKYARKPSPEGILTILNHFRIKPENTLVIGDSTHDIHAARAANTKVCAVTYGFRSKEILKKEAPDCMIDKIIELKECIS